MTQEALKLALEALEDFVDVIKYDNEQDDIGRRACCDVLSYNPHSESCKAKQAITAIKAALAQPEQEPVADHFAGAGKMMPVAWVDLQKEAQQIVESKILWKRFIDGTPLANDIACWMADFAQQYARPPQLEQNYCPRCGKRTNEIHTCTPPQEKNT